MWSPPTTPLTMPAAPVLAAWHRTWTREGVRFVGVDGAVTVAHGRALPSPLLAELLAPRGDGFRRGVTLEGEHVVRFAQDGRATAWILGDRHRAVVEADTASESCTELVDTLARTFPLRLGAQRARRFEVATPAGWCATACDLTVRLESPDGFFSIPAATPLGDADLVEKFLYEEMLVGLVPERIESWPVALACGLDGELVRVVARHRDAAAPITFWTAVLHDDRHRYAIRLEAPARSAFLDSTFAQVVESVRPIPRPTPKSIPALFVID